MDVVSYLLLLLPDNITNSFSFAFAGCMDAVLPPPLADDDGPGQTLRLITHQLPVLWI